MARFHALIAGTLISLSTVAPARAQACEPAWSDQFGYGALNGEVRAMITLDEDGDGPLPPVLIAGGAFLQAGTVTANHIARWDGTSWSGLGAGLDGEVYALAIFDDDADGPHPASLYAGGSFTVSGEVTVNNIAKWDGTSWLPVGGGTDLYVPALAVFDDDGPGPHAPALYAGGAFTSAGGVPASHVARWDGNSWSPLGSGVSGFVYALTEWDPDGNGPLEPALYVAGSFSDAGGASAPNIARWDGSSWSPLGGYLSASVYALTVFDDDGPGGSPPALYAGGSFTSPFTRVAKWNGTTWSGLGNGTNNTVYALTAFDEDGPGPQLPALYAGGIFTTAGGLTVNAAARWNGSSWSALSAGPGIPVYAFSAFDIDGNGSAPARLLAGQSGGTITSPGYIRVWDGASWGRLDHGISPVSPSPLGALVAAMATWNDPANGPALYVGGIFAAAGGVPANSIARWNGTTWSPLGVGVAGATYAIVESLLAFDDDGDGPHVSALYVGGQFTSAGGAAASSIAKWDGSAWSPLGSGITGYTAEVLALESFDEDGPGQSPPALFAGGSFTMAGGMPASRIARWNGAQWSPVGTGVQAVVPIVSSLAVFDEDGNGPGQPALFVAGYFDSAGGIPAHNVARWNGMNWSAADTGVVGAVTALTVVDLDGDGPMPAQLFAAGQFAGPGGATVNTIGRWDGNAWSPVADAVNNNINDMALFDPDGDGSAPSQLYIGGDFTMAGGVPANRIAAWNGSSWSGLDDGLWTPAGYSSTFLPAVFALSIFDDDGSGPQPPPLYAGGDFFVAGEVASARIARWGCPVPPRILGAVPPVSSPYALSQPFRDVLQNTTDTLVPQGIGFPGTPTQGPYSYAPIALTFNGTPSPAPDASNTAVTCTDIAGNSQSDCPSIASLSGSGTGPYQITLSAPPPPRECITLTFAGAAAGQKLQYQVLPGDTNLDGVVSTQDLLFLVQRINDGTANLPVNYARFNINRSQEPGSRVNTQDLLRLVQLLNGTNATQAFNGATVAPCP